MDADAAAQALWEAADDHGDIIRDGLPERVRAQMQQVVDTCLWACEHVQAAADLPPAALAKLCVAGGRAISCLQPACVLAMHDLSYQRRLKACVLCGHRVPSYHQVLFSDDAAGLSMSAPVCYPCAAPGGRLADWAGLPGA